MKRVISIILSLMMILSALSLVCFANPVTGPDNIAIPKITAIDGYILGDADGNGEVNALDARAVKSAIAKGEDVPNYDSADFNADGTITSADVYYLKSVLAGAKNASDFALETNVGSLSIGGANISLFEAVVPAETTYNDNRYMAYEYLSKYLEIATGYALPLTYGETSATGHGIYFNSVDFDSEYGQSLGVDGYSYKVENGNLYIYGTLRGNGYAVFDILEKWLGFYFCSVDGAYSYTKRSVDIPEGYEKTYVPQFFLRSVSGPGGGSNVYYMRVRGMSSMVNESSWYNNAYCGYITGDAIGTVHTFDEFRAIVRGELPEGAEDTTTNYYLKRYNGLAGLDISKQVCACSDEAYDEIFDGMLMWIQHIAAAPGKYFGTEYGVTYAAFGPSDNQEFCSCTLCRNIAQGNSLKRATQSQLEWVQKNYSGEYTYTKNGAGTTYTITFHKEYNTGLYLNMVNRAARDIQEYYPGLKVLSYFYPNDVPETVRPESNVFLWYCSGLNVACVRHPITESDKCIGYQNELIPAEDQLKGIEGWREICDETGAELGYWCYFTNYCDQIYELPDYDTFYYDIHKLAEIGLDGVFYEGASHDANNNPLESRFKVYLAQELIWNPNMTYGEFRGLMQKYLTAVYGDAGEDIYSYILMTEEATMASEYCYAVWYKVFDVFSKEYMAAHYLEMRSCLESAREKVRPEKVYDVDFLLASLDFIGLSAVYDEWYADGDETTRARYCSMYDSFYNSATANGFSFGGTASLPSEISYDKSPSMQVYRTEHQLPRK